ncbi:hypothetical protein CAEBREN_13153 [Caenorhabditis brenneri]|uniref:Uncharacterized protein n=1 Tax=Caenorhabditis brenneri TaxID=135651 RepID=G0MFV8_CAEBE|nr:hypothetical protein CAEBREN_13153 [Caenorhabditis brenneri]
MAATRSSTRRRKAPNRFHDDESFFPPPPIKRRPKKRSVVEAAAPAHVVLTSTPPPANVKVPGAPKRRYNCEEQECDCFEIEMREWIATRNMKTREEIKTAKKIGE